MARLSGLPSSLSNRFVPYRFTCYYQIIHYVIVSIFPLGYLSSLSSLSDISLILSLSMPIAYTAGVLTLDLKPSFMIMPLILFVTYEL